MNSRSGRQNNLETVGNGVELELTGKEQQNDLELPWFGGHLKSFSEEVFMGAKRERHRRHSAAFKCEAVQVLNRRLAAGVSLRRISDELDIKGSLLTKWAEAVAAAPAEANADDIFPGSGRARRFPERAAAGEVIEPPEVELRRLRRENERLRQERDFLKKAAAFFAKESR
jgi:transposase